MHAEMTPSTPGANGWQRFWNRGGWWRSLLLVVAYYALYQLGSLAFIPLYTSTDDPAALVWFGTVLPVALGGFILLLFAWSVGWLRELFGRQPIGGRGWMWIAVVVVLLSNVLRFATVDYGAAGAGIVLAWLVGGLCVGFAEEVLTRGFVVNLMRKGGYREITVAAVSAALFAVLHAGNLLSGQSPFATAFQLVYTFAFGILMYLTLRVTGNLIWPILLHASTDPSIFLMTLHPSDSPLTGVANLGNFAVILTGLVLLIFIRGRVEKSASPELGTPIAA